MEKQQFKFTGYAYIEKPAKNGGNSARVFVPLSWVGKRVAVVLLEPIGDE